MVYPKGVVYFLAFALCLSSVLAIRCYECNSKTRAECADASRLGSLYTDCSTIPGRDRCLRSKGPADSVTRMCSSSTAAGFTDGCQIVTNNVESCLCSTDYCNGAAPLKYSVLFYVLGAIGLYITGCLQMSLP